MRMDGAKGLRALVIFATAALTACSTPKRDLQSERLQESWQSVELQAEREFAPELAREVDELIAKIRTAESREARSQALYLLERRIAIFQAGARLTKNQQQAQELERQITSMRLELSEIATNKAHLETERTRLQAIAQAEEAERVLEEQRAQAEADVLAQTEAAELARNEARIARELAAIQAQEADIARREAELRGDQLAALERQIAGLREANSSRGKTLILGDAFFSSGQGELNAVAKKNLKPVLDFLRKYPSLPVLIEGHTDGKGSAAGNLKLSQLRADSVRKNLIAQGAEGSRLTAQGFGESMPLAGNDVESGRAKNRRVEITIEGAK